MSQPAVICRLGPESVPDLVCIELQSGDPPWSEGLFLGEFSNSHARVYGVRSRGRLVGFLVCHVVVDEAHILNLAILPEFRRLGLARALLNHVLADFHDRGVCVVTLEVRRGNIAALGLYETIGFREAGIRAGYYRSNGEDALIMRLDVAQFVEEHSDRDGI